MKRVSLLVMLALLLAMVPVATAFAKSPPAQYLALGNSVPRGLGGFGYVHQVHKALKNSSGPMTLANLTVIGDNSDTFIGNGLPAVPAQLYRALATIGGGTDTEVVTLDLGFNDLIGLTTTAELADALTNFGNNYGAILIALTAALDVDPNDEDFLVLTAYNPFRNGSVFGEPLASLEADTDLALLGGDLQLTISCSFDVEAGNFRGLNDIIFCTGIAVGATVVDIYTVIDIFDTHVLTGRGPLPNIHPNSAGHTNIANEVKVALG